MSEEGRHCSLGKYRGQPVAVMMADQDYCAWAMSQPGIRERDASLFTVIINGGVAPDPPTPEHNRMQLLFRDQEAALRRLPLEFSNKRGSTARVGAVGRMTDAPRPKPRDNLTNLLRKSTPSLRWRGGTWCSAPMSPLVEAGGRRRLSGYLARHEGAPARGRLWPPPAPSEIPPSRPDRRSFRSRGRHTRRRQMAFWPERHRECGRSPRSARLMLDVAEAPFGTTAGILDGVGVVYCAEAKEARRRLKEMLDADRLGGDRHENGAVEAGGERDRQPDAAPKPSLRERLPRSGR